jgi:ATP-dependent DNA helicase DinG
VTQAAHRTTEKGARDVAALFTDEARAEIRSEIELAGGAEVFFYGRVDESGLVVEVEVCARGNEASAPAILARAGTMDVAIHNHPSGDLRPSDADVGVASALGGQGLAFYIVSQDVDRAYVVVPLLAKRERAPVGQAEVAALFADDGAIARTIAGFESRPGQVAMAKLVARAFDEDGIALLEAGTGTGKTFAYLAPAALFAKRNRERVVVATGTINLQEQLAAKDVPALQRAGVPMDAVVVKGRSNYVSLRRAEEAAQAEPAVFEDDEERAEVDRLVAWAKTTKTGDRQEIVPPPTPGAWEKVESQTDNCLRARCPRFQDCHFFASRRAAARADVVVANHHLLFADLAAKHEIGSLEQAAVLPPFRRVILDEAHHLEDAASEHFGARITGIGVERLLGRLRAKRDGRRGILPALEARLAKALQRTRDVEDVGRVEAALRAVEEELAPLQDRVAFETLEGLARAGELARSAAKEDESRAAKLRLLAGDRASEGVAEVLAHAREGLAHLSARLGALLEGLSDALGEARGPIEGTILETRAVAGRLARMAGALELAANLGDKDHVRWIEVSRGARGRDRVAIHAIPLDVAPLVRKRLLEPLATVVMSSATLTVGGSFEYLERALGVDAVEPIRVARAVLPSPFDLESQAVLGVPLDIPDPKSPQFEDEVGEVVLEAATRTRGAAFVLFTSHGALARVHRKIAGRLRERGLMPLKQGDEPRRALLDRFKQTRGAVLFGTDSFWEGVDVPGDALVLVAIAKLPFRVPTEPREQAQAEAIAARGGDPFVEMTIPRAVLKMKQGFGRLIRTKTDRGAVLVLDPRIARKGYGRAFIASLPSVPVVAGPRARVLDAVERVAGPAP